MLKILVRSIRPLNLVMIIVFVIVLRYEVLGQFIKLKGLNFYMSDWLFVILVASIFLVSAAGYLFNDYYDYEQDLEFGKRQYHPRVSKNLLWNLAIIFSVVGVLLGIFVAFYYKMLTYGFIGIIVILLLWLYSDYYKKVVLWGNLIIALLAGMLPLIVLISEVVLQIKYNKNFLINIGYNFSDARVWFLGYAIFAFWFTLIREIVKDAEDYDADLKWLYRTIPIYFGKRFTNKLLAIMVVIGLVGVLYATKFLVTEGKLYVLLFIVLPLIFVFLNLFSKYEKRHYSFISKLLKFVMFCAIVYPLFFNL